MSKKLNREIKCIDPLQGHNKRQGFSHYTDRDIRSNVLFAPNQCSIHVPMVQCPSSVPRPQCSNIFSETAWRIKAKFYVEPPWIGQMKVCSLGLGRYIDTSMHRDTDLADTRIDTLGAVSRYF